MSALEIIEQIRAPLAERANVAKFAREEDDSWVPESFKEGMNAVAEDRFVDLNTAMFEDPPSHLR